MSRIFMASLAVLGFVACANGDELLYRYEAAVVPFEESAGWRIANGCNREKNCERSVENGHYVLRWRGGGDIVNYDLNIPVVDQVDSFWVEWRFRSNWPFPPPEPGCDGRFALGGAHDPILLHGDMVITQGADAFVTGLELNAFHTFRYEHLRGDHFRISVDGFVFQNKPDDANDEIQFLQFGALGSCNRKIGVEVPENAWDFIRYGTISDGELVVASDPPAGVIDANAYPNLDRFTITFDQPGYIYVDQITVSVTGGVAPAVTKTRRLDNGPTDVVEVVLDRPIPLGETTTFTFNDGVATNVVSYTYLSLGACCFDDGICGDFELSKPGASVRPEKETVLAKRPLDARRTRHGRWPPMHCTGA